MRFTGHSAAAVDGGDGGGSGVAALDRPLRARAPLPGARPASPRGPGRWVRRVRREVAKLCFYHLSLLSAMARALSFLGVGTLPRWPASSTTAQLGARGAAARGRASPRRRPGFTSAGDGAGGCLESLTTRTRSLTWRPASAPGRSTPTATPVPACRRPPRVARAPRARARATRGRRAAASRA